MKLAQTLTESDLDSFYGGGDQYRHPSGVLYTDGVLNVAEKAGAFWLIDAIYSYQGERQITRDPMLRDFQIWVLEVTEGRAVLRCLRDTDDEAFHQVIEYTDFPLAEAKFYLENGCLMLPCER